MAERRAKTRRATAAGLLLLLLLLLLALWCGRPSVAVPANGPQRGMVGPAPLHLGVGASEPRAAEPDAEGLPREVLRVWLHDPRWLWWSNTVPPMPYADLELPAAWRDEVADHPTWLALLEGRADAVEDAVATADATDADPGSPAQAAVSLLGALEVERSMHRSAFIGGIRSVLPPGETWGSMGAEARQQHHDEGRVPMGLDDAQLALDLAEVEARWPDDPYLADIARLVEVRLVLESAATHRQFTHAEREAMAVELLEQVVDPQVRVAVGEAIVERAFRPSSMETVDAVTQAFPQDGGRALNMAVWALDVATRLQDWQGMERGARMVEEQMASFCVDEESDWRQEAKCPTARSAVMSTMSRLASLDGPVFPTTWREEMVTAGWRCARALGGVRTLTRGTSMVEVTWDGSAWQWGPWPDDPGLGDCMRRTPFAFGPEEPLVVEVTVEVGR